MACEVSRRFLLSRKMLLLHLIENCICPMQHHERSGGGPGVQSCRTSPRSGEPRPSLSHIPRLPDLPSTAVSKLYHAGFSFERWIVTPSFTSVFTKAHCCIQTLAIYVQSPTLHSVSGINLNITLHSHLRFGFPNGLFPTELLGIDFSFSRVCCRSFPSYHCFNYPNSEFK